MTAAEAAVSAGLPEQMTYSADETAEYTGIPYETLLEEIKGGALRAFVRLGRTKGYRIRPEWVDEWLEEGSHNGATRERG